LPRIEHTSREKSEEGGKDRARPKDRILLKFA
jgi:hypothetical protein